MKKFFGFLLALVILLAPVFGEAQQTRGDFVQVVLQALSTPTAGEGTGSTVSRMHNFKDAIILLNMVAATAQNSATHRVLIQTSPDTGTSWIDLASFANSYGFAGGAVSQLMQWTSLSVTTALRNLNSINRNMAAGTVNHGPAGSLWRVVWDVGSASTGSWRFSVTGFFRR